MASLHISKQPTLATDRGRADKLGAWKWKMICGVLLLCAATTIAAQAQTFTTLVEFNNTNGSNPVGALAQGTDGNLYGTTFGGGTYGGGTVFRLTPAGTLTTLYNFCAQTGCADGSNPSAGMVLATDGNLYGTTSGGGANGSGTVFSITEQGTLTTLYSLQQNPDGASPAAALIQGADGNLYGTANNGGLQAYVWNRPCWNDWPPGCGTVFQITPAGNLTLVHSFRDNGTDGKYPADGMWPLGLVQFGDLFVGITSQGGTTNVGTIFEVAAMGNFKTLHDFDGYDGAYPVGALALAPGGFYGTTLGLWNWYWNGTVFKFGLDGTLTTLYDFCCAAYEGANPKAGLVLATDNNLYGTTSGGGTGNNGTVFQITLQGTLTYLHNFAGGDGSSPAAELFQATDGNLYGTTSGGGTSNNGTVFSLSVGLLPFVKTSPTSGGVGMAVTILGNNLTGSTGVKFNGTPATFTVVSSTEIQATVPSGATSGKVKVLTPGGILTSNTKFLVTPEILSFSPPSGPVGTSVVITGESFTGADDVRLGFGEQMSFTVDSDTQITAIVPAAATSGRIIVHTPGGQAKSASAFDVTP